MMTEYIMQVDDDGIVYDEIREPVVRCRDCRWYDERNRGCANMDTYMEPQEFCSLGERREDG